LGINLDSTGEFAEVTLVSPIFLVKKQKSDDDVEIKGHENNSVQDSPKSFDFMNDSMTETEHTIILSVEDIIKTPILLGPSQTQVVKVYSSTDQDREDRPFIYA
jgi:hypothetical protein